MSLKSARIAVYWAGVKLLMTSAITSGRPTARANYGDARHWSGRIQCQWARSFVKGQEPDGHALHFEIESWARAGDQLSALPYNKLRLAKEIQLNMWSHFCVRAAELAGRPQGGVIIRTRWVPWP